MNNNYCRIDELYHHGILGQKWGKKNGPPYPLKGKDYSITEVNEIYEQRKKTNSIYNKKHFDKTIRENKDRLMTLSYDKNRTKNTDMFYATYDPIDKRQYLANFNKKIPQPLYDSENNCIGTSDVYKMRIENVPKKDIKIASEDSGVDAFRLLYKNNRNFYNFVTERMEPHFVKSKYKFKGYREARDVLQKIKSPNYVVSDKDLRVLYRMFNYVLPSTGNSERDARDVATVRNVFFSELKKKGYSGVLDTNDSIYGGFKANAPVIIFDMESIALGNISQTKLSDKVFSALVWYGSRMF